jgi:hypothetical protein
MRRTSKAIKSFIIDKDIINLNEVDENIVYLLFFSNYNGK